MEIGRIYSWKKVFTQLLLLVLPTLFIIGFLLFNANRYYSILQNNWFEQTLFFTTGILLGTILYAYRLRFFSTSFVLFFVIFTAYNLLGKISIGEFDAFFFTIKFLIFTYLFSLGWIAGYGFSRSRFFTIFFSVLLLTLQIIVVSKTTEIAANQLIAAFAPVLLYSFYLIYTAELIRNMNEDVKGVGWFISKRIAGFLLLSLTLLVSILLIFQKE